MLRCSLPLLKPCTGLVVRPLDGSGSGCGSSSLQQQTLVFFADEVRTLEGGSRGEPFRLGPQLALVDGASGGGAMQPFALQGAGCAVLEPASGCVFFVDGTAIMRVDSGNVVTLVAGSRQQAGSADGAGEAARFTDIRALAADGRGAVYAAEPTCVRVLSVGGPGTSGAGAAAARCTTVATLPDSVPASGLWVSLAYDCSAGMLLAATERALCSVPTSAVAAGGGGGDDAARGSVRVLAGNWSVSMHVDGNAAAARFQAIRCVVLDGEQRILVVDYANLRRVDGHSAVSTVVRDCFNYEYLPPSMIFHLCILPSGQCAAALGMLGTEWVVDIFGNDIAACSEPLRRPIREQVLDYMAVANGDGLLGGTGTATVVTVRVGDRAFVVHRQLLAERSDYFKQLFEGGFADSGAAEVALPDADPDALVALLGFIYWGVLDVPYSLLRPTAELAGRLLMPHACGRLTARLLAACTPASVVSDLLWAEKHSMGAVEVQLKAYFLQHAKEVVQAAPAVVDELIAASPRLAASLICALSSR